MYRETIDPKALKSAVAAYRRECLSLVSACIDSKLHIGDAAKRHAIDRVQAIHTVCTAVYSMLENESTDIGNDLREVLHIACDSALTIHSHIADR